MTDQIVVTGNITSVPERLQAAGGDTIAKFGLASTERKHENGQWVDVHTSFYSIAAFGRLADHALNSLEKGQRVIVVGKLRIKKWDVGERSGSTADITATSLGHDLKFGVTRFQKRVGGTSAEARLPHSHDEWAAPGDHDAALGGDAPQTVREGVDAPVESLTPSPEPALVGAAAWSAPGSDETPF